MGRYRAKPMSSLAIRMNCSILNTKLGAIEFSSTGKGEPILFVHGGHSNCHETLCHRGINSEEHTLIIPSRPGYGETPLDTKKTPKQTADLFIELLNQLNIEKTVVYGVSAGGLTAIELASHYPDRVNKLILASAVTKKWMNTKSPTYRIAKLIFHPKIESITWASVRLFSSLAPRLLAKSFHSQFSSKSLNRISKSEINRLMEILEKYRSKEGFLNDLDQNIETKNLTRVSCPTLIVHSQYDNSVPYEHAQHAHKYISNSKLIELQNDWGHLLWVGEDSHKAINKIVGFLEEK